LFQPAATGKRAKVDIWDRGIMLHPSTHPVTHPPIPASLGLLVAATRVESPRTLSPASRDWRLTCGYELMSVRIFITPGDRYDGHPSTDHLIRID
jgi:hypothetical protein